MISKTSSILGFITILQLAIGLLSQLFVIKILGVGELTDAFIAAQTIPAILSTILVTVFQSVYLPSLSVKSKFPNRWNIEQGKAHTKLFVMFGGLFLILFLLSDIILNLIFQGFDEEQIKLTKYLFIFFMISFWLNTHSHIFAITLRTIDKFVLADSILLIGTVINLFLIFFLLNKEDIKNLGFIYILSSLMVFFVLYAISGRPKLIFKNIFKNNKNWKLMIPLIKGNVLYKMSPIVDRYLLSHSFSGAMTIYNIANMINSSIITFISKTIITMHLPRIANLAKKKNIIELTYTYKKILFQILLLTILVVSIMICLKSFWSDLIYLVFKIDKEQSNVLWWILILFSGILFSGLAVSITTSYFYSFHDTKTPTKIGIRGFLISIPLKIILFYMYGVIGLAIASTIHQASNFIILHYLILNKMKLIEINNYKNLINQKEVKF